MQTAELADRVPAPTGSVDILAQEVHPWRRYFARMVDMNLSLLLVVVPVLLLIILLLTLIAPALLPGLSTGLDQFSKFNLIVNILITCLLWIPIESLYMCTLGTTPGKWVFGIKVRDEFGNKLKFGLALKRASSVYLIGLGAGLPVISLVTLVRSYNRLTKESITLWDESLGTAVIYTDFGVFRILGSCLVLVLWVAFTIYGNIS